MLVRRRFRALRRETILMSVPGEPSWSAWQSEFDLGGVLLQRQTARLLSKVLDRI